MEWPMLYLNTFLHSLPQPAEPPQRPFAPDAEHGAVGGVHETFGGLGVVVGVLHGLVGEIEDEDFLVEAAGGQVVPLGRDHSLPRNVWRLKGDKP